MRMKKWFSSLGYRIQYFMQGRYGYDELCRFLSISALVLLLLSYIPYLGFSIFLLSLCWYGHVSGRSQKHIQAANGKAEIPDHQK